GTRKIIDTFKEYNVFSDELYAAGGIAEKDPFIMQVYADVLGLDIKISGSPQSGALGSAIFGAVAAGYGDISEVSQKMCKLGNIVYRHNPENKKIYDQLYAEYEILHDYFGRGGNDVMKRLKNIRKI
ncbi:MAG: FGGY-family carbohydrate kinase, partial [Oscillospiraceae bacterium]|nr:FGGY-family carbohydrate kinase [Oscillospiraceae bacterium]